MIAEPRTRFVLPDELNAAEPPEARGLNRDQVRLMVATGDGVEHAAFGDLGNYLRPGDLLVVNTSGTFAAAVDGTRIAPDGVQPVVVHFSTPLDDGDWVVELRTAPDAAHPMLDARPGERVELAAGTLHLVAPYNPGPGPATNSRTRTDAPGGTAYLGGGVRLWRARAGMAVPEFLRRRAGPIVFKAEHARISAIFTLDGWGANSRCQCGHASARGDLRAVGHAAAGSRNDDGEPEDLLRR